MKLIIKGGKVLNRGFVGIVMELYNDNKEDNKTLYQELSLSNPAKIKLVSTLISSNFSTTPLIYPASVSHELTA